MITDTWKISREEYNRRNWKQWRRTRLWKLAGIFRPDSALLTALGVLCLALAMPSRTDAASGPFKMQVQFSGYNRAETLTNFPVLVVFSNGMGGTSFTFTNYPFLTANGSDLRFIDSTGTTNLNYEIERWTNAASTSAYVWVQVPLITTNTDCIWAKWGDPSNTNQLPCATNGAVWPTSAFAGVWHMVQSNTLDSTANRNNGTAITTVSNVTGIVDGAQKVNGGGHVSIPYSSSLDFTNPAATYSAWVRFNTLPSGEQVVMRKEQFRELGFGTEAQPNVRNMLQTGGISGWTANNDEQITPTPVTGQWYYTAFTYDGNVIRNFWNGVPLSAGKTVTGNISTDIYTTCFGAYAGNNDAGPVSLALDASIDEVRIEQVFRSTNWIRATYMTVALNSVFATMSAPTQANTPWINNDGGASNIAPTTATLCGNLVSTGTAPTTVYVFWGAGDAGTNKAGWANPVNFGPRGLGPVATNVTGLSGGTMYFYRYYATNLNGDA